MIIYNGTQDQEAYKSVLSRVIEQLCEEDRDVVFLDADLTNSSGLSSYWQRNKRQVVNCGVAEANMIGIAAGLSAAGKKPYAHSFGPFASRRSFDQSFLSVAYAGLSVRVLGSDPGVTAAYNGGTHMPFEDIALMRSVPQSTVIEISDASNLEFVLKATKERGGLNYIRFSRKTYPALYSKDHQFEIGKSEVVRDGKDVTVIACGLMVSEALKAADLLSAEGITCRVVDMFTIKPLDDETVAECAKETGAIITAENHNVIGGLGEAVASSILSSGIPVRFKKVGINDAFGSVGTQPELQAHYGLTAEAICQAVREML